MTDFFISYTHTDTSWAEWIAYVLEEDGFSVVIQAWDFRPGSNFVLEMQKAASAAERTLMVLSPDYLKSGMAAAEWAGAFAQDSQGLDRRLVPVMVRECSPTGLLPAIVQIRIMGLDEEAARAAISAGVSQKRAKPSQRPIFPGQGAQHVAQKAFPGPQVTAPKAAMSPRSTVLPAIKRPATDADKRRFAKAGLGTIRETFAANLEAAGGEDARIETDFTSVSDTEFRAELFLDGRSKCRCRVWLGGMMGDNNICYAEGGTAGNACNEIIGMADGGDLLFTAIMAMGFSGGDYGFDTKRMTAEDAAGYLWHRFVAPLRY